MILYPVSAQATDGDCIVPVLVRKSRNQYEIDKHGVFLTGCANDFSDVRFFAPDGSQLPYYKHSHGNFCFAQDSGLLHAQVEAAGGVLLSGGTSAGAGVGGIFKSADNGASWQNVFSSTAAFCWIDSVGNKFAYTPYKMIRCPATDTAHTTWVEVLDMTAVSGQAIAENFCEDKFGHLYFGRYQGAFDVAIYKSEDRGLTWTRKYTNTTQQHCHCLKYDPYRDVIYAGLDGTVNALVRSSDFGETWEVLTTGIVSSGFDDMYIGDGFRLGGGESTVLGSALLHRTTDDVTWTPVLKCLGLITGIEKLGSSIYVFSAANYANRYAQVYRSTDDGLTWKTVFYTQYTVSDYTSAGLRYVSSPCVPNGETESQLIVGALDSAQYTGVRVFDGGDNWQALFFVKVSIGSAGGSIGVVSGQTGGLASSKSSVFGHYPAGLALRVPLDEGAGTAVSDVAGGKSGVLTPGGGSWGNPASRVGTIMPDVSLLGSSFEFSGNGGVVVTDSGADAALHPVKNFTLLAWVRGNFSSTDGTFKYVCGHGITDATGSIGLYIRPRGQLGFRAQTSVTDKETYSITCDGKLVKCFMDDQGPHLIGFTLSDAEPPTLRFSFDGMLDNAGIALPASPSAGAGNWTIGADVSGADRFIGAINDVQLYNRALSSAEIRSIFEAGPLYSEFNVAPFDSTLPALTLSPTCPGKLKQVQEWSKVASAREIERY